MLQACRPPVILLTLALLCPAFPASAQQLGRLPVVSQHLTPGLAGLQDDALDRVARVEPRLKSALPRQTSIAIRLRRHAAVLDIDAAGAPVVRGEVIVIEPTPDTLARATAAGFRVTAEHTLAALGFRALVLRAGPGISTPEALATLRRIAPNGEFDYNHLYQDAGLSGTAHVALAAAPTPFPASSDTGFKVGLVDSGVAEQHPALAGVRIRRWGCQGRTVPDAHGSAVASLLAGNPGGSTPSGSTLYSADIYCGDPTGGAVTGLVGALEWMAREGVPVINLSMVGPSNALLRKATEAIAGRGHLLVAAVGNDGPAAPPLYPAAYPHVIAVTAVNQRDRALTEAGRGPHVELAAPGEHPRTALADGKWGPVRGTSFAAPLVARAAAGRLAIPDPDAAKRVRAQLAADAVDLGRRGRDDTYGHGLIETKLAIAANK
ncbi:MAG: S8 family serine peptidase [Lysobacter sp.]